MTIFGNSSNWETFQPTTINDIGDTVGWLVAPDGLHHAMRWDGERFTDLGPGLAYDVDNRRRIVGIDGSSGGNAVLWDRRRVVLLENESYMAGDINDFGAIVGSCSDVNAGNGRAILWTDPSQRGADLNTMLEPEDAAAGWILVQATRLNNRGSVLGYAINPLRRPENNCNPYSFLLEPVD